MLAPTPRLVCHIVQLACVDLFVGSPVGATVGAAVGATVGVVVGAAVGGVTVATQHYSAFFDVVKSCNISKNMLMFFGPFQQIKGM